MMTSPIIKIIRSKKRKRTISIEVTIESVNLRVPYRLSNQEIKKIIAQRSPWIEKKRQIQAKNPLPKPKTFTNGEFFSYLGKDYPLWFIPNASKGVKLQENSLQISIPSNLPIEKTPHYTKKRITTWYRSQALEELTQRTQKYATILGVQPHSIKVRSYKSRWGSCSITGDISYNWQIIMAPSQIVDYTVVHELCHLIEHNHSQAYWKQVAAIFPTYKQDRQWLKTHGTHLFL